MSRKKILMLIPDYGYGGAEHIFYKQSVELAKKHDVLECVFNLDIAPIYISNNKILNLNVPAGRTFIFKCFNFFLRCYYLKKIKKKYQIDVCISHLEGADYANILSQRKEKIILYIHGSKLHDKNIRGVIGWIRKKFLMPFLYKRADKITTVSEGIRLELIEEIGVPDFKVETIYNFFEPELILSKINEPIESELQSILANCVSLVLCGRLAKEKNFISVLKIVAALRHKTKIRLIIIGDGDERDALVRECISLNLKAHSVWDNDEMLEDREVIFLGYRANPVKYIACCSIFILSSNNEGFPMALGEAMHCGVPIVSTDCPTGPREILAPYTQGNYGLKEAEFAEYGILMPLLNSIDNTLEIQAWVETLEKLVNDKSLQKHYIEKARQRIQAFTKQKIFKDWERVLKEV